MSNPALITLNDRVAELKGLVDNTPQQHTQRCWLLTNIELSAREHKLDIRQETAGDRVVEESNSPRHYEQDCARLGTLVADMKTREIEFQTNRELEYKFLNDIENLAEVMRAEEVRQNGYGRTYDTTTSISDSTSGRGGSSRGGGSRPSRFISLKALGISLRSAGTGK